jgi:hypothetical protein
MKFVILGMLACAAVFGDAPRILYTKEFKGSAPPYVAVTLDRGGEGVYKEAVNDDNPLSFKLRPAEVDQIFQLAEKLDHFKRPLESNLKVAHMGIKTFRFEQNGVHHEVKFNYSIDEDARILADWFEKIVESEQHFIRLERTVKYDKLGVNQALLLFQISYERKRIVAAEQYLPLLDRVAKNDAYLNMARDRAAALAEDIRNPKPAKGE